MLSSRYLLKKFQILNVIFIAVKAEPNKIVPSITARTVSLTQPESVETDLLKKKYVLRQAC